MSHVPSPTMELPATPGIEALNTDQEPEVLDFLSRRPIHTVCMTSYIREHGIVSPLNRGRFYGYRHTDGGLDGVALIGHASLLETDNEEALRAFALIQYQRKQSHLVRGEQEMIARFRKHYAALGSFRGRSCFEVLFEQKTAPDLPGPVPALRLAAEEDLQTIIRINAQMLLSECGVDPLRTDPLGFRERVARRVKRGRVWVWTKGERVVFKADIFAETPQMIYLEGINVHPEERGRGYGLRCMAQLGHTLLRQSDGLCLLVNEGKTELRRFYLKAGYEVRGLYETVYLD